jgi:hypothetical protein
MADEQTDLAVEHAATAMRFALAAQLALTGQLTVTMGGRCFRAVKNSVGGRGPDHQHPHPSPRYPPGGSGPPGALRLASHALPKSDVEARFAT